MQDHGNGPIASVIATSVKLAGAVGDNSHNDQANIQAVINAGKDPYFPDGEYKITSQLVLPTDRDVTFYFGSNARLRPVGNIACFYIPNGLTGRRYYTFHGARALGAGVSNSQKFIESDNVPAAGPSDTSAHVVLHDPNIQEIKTFVKVNAGSWNEAFTVDVWGGLVKPLIAAGACNLIETPVGAGNFGAAYCSLLGHRAFFGNPMAQDGWSMDADAEVILQDQSLLQLLGNGNKINALDVYTGSAVQGNGSGTTAIQEFGIQWFTFGHKDNFALTFATLKLSFGCRIGKRYDIGAVIKYDSDGLYSLVRGGGLTETVCTIPDGTHGPLTATIELPDFDKRIIFEPEAKIDLTSNAVAAFTVPNTVTAKRVYEFVCPQVIGNGAAAQSFLKHDSTIPAKINVENPIITGIKTPFDVSAVDVTYVEIVDIQVVGGRIIPPTSDGTSVLCKSTTSAGVYNGAQSVTFTRTTLMDATDFTKGWKIDFDGDLILRGPHACFFVGANKVDGLLVRDGDGIGSRDNPTLASMEIFGGNYIVGDGGLFCTRIDNIIVKASHSFGHFVADDCEMLKAGKILVNSPGAKISVQTATWLPGTPDYVVDILAGADDCAVCDSYLVNGTSAMVRTAAQRTRVNDCRFGATGGCKTIEDTGAGDYTLGVGNIGVSTGGGLSLNAAHSKCTVGDYNFA